MDLAPLQSNPLTPLFQLEACTNTDYDCLCRASEAVATCFNNCPKDPRNAVSRSQITIHVCTDRVLEQRHDP
jgi:hypothetical protein